MTSYTNSYFNIKIDFPENWLWRSSSANSTSKMRFQTADDDLPTENGDVRSLVSAMRKGRGQHKLIGVQLFVGIHKERDYDLRRAIKHPEEIIESSFDKLTILGQQAESAKIVRQVEGNLYFSQTVIYKVESDILLTIYLAGDTAENFREAEQLFERISQA